MTVDPTAPRAEAYRLFFPLGVVLGVAGVAIWPLYHFGVIASYSGRAHAMIQVAGFLYSFITGFLMTALPRMTQTPPPRLRFKLVVAALIIGSVIAFELSEFRWGQLLFLAAQTAVMGAAARRAYSRRADPPDSFVLVAFGLAFGAGGTLVNALIDWEELDPLWSLFGMRLLTEGMVLSLVLGVGAFLEPRIMGLLAPPSDKDDRSVAPAPKPLRARSAFAAGVMIATTLYLQYAQSIASAGLLRAAGVTLVLAATVPPWRWPRARTTLARTIWLANWCVLAGEWGPAFFPDYGVDLMHFLFMGGFSLLILAIATRVVLAHGRLGLERETKSLPLRIAGTCVVIGLLSRIGAAFAVESYFEHLAVAGIFWIAGVLLWGAVITRWIVRNS